MGIIFTGGPNSVYLEESPHVDPEDVPSWAFPILGICYGCQLMAYTLGGQVTAAQEDTAREYGKTVTYFDYSAASCSPACPEQAITWMSHGDYMAKVPDGFALVAHTDACPNAAICRREPGLLRRTVPPGGESHPVSAARMLRNFLYEICGAKGDWTMGDYLKTPMVPLRVKKSAQGHACCWRCPAAWIPPLLAALLAEAVGDQSDRRLCRSRLYAQK